MFIGHFAAGFAAKPLAPRTSLAALLGAALLLDGLWPVFVLLGLEAVRIDPGNTRVTPLDFVHYPWSHSLAMALVWAAALALLHGRRRRDRRAAVVLGLAVVSHWVLDWVSHRPDLALYPGGAARVGLGLWDSVPGTLAIEGGLFALGVWIYARATRPRDRRGALGLVALVAVLLLLYGASLFGPPPPSVAAVVWGDLAGWLLVAWAAAIDRHRAPV
jgi:hypothetical protein